MAVPVTDICSARLQRHRQAANLCENGGHIEHFPLPPSVVSADRVLIEERDQLRAAVGVLRAKVEKAIEILS
jgi:hypothetical protein